MINAVNGNLNTVQGLATLHKKTVMDILIAEELFREPKKEKSLDEDL